MSGELLVAIVFRFINFGILVAFVVYFFNKYVVKTIKKQMQKRATDKKDMHEQLTVLYLQKEQLAWSLEQEKEECEEVKNNIIQWKKRVDEHLVEREKIKQEQVQILQEIVRKNREYIEQENIKNKLLPQAILQAEESLQKQYAPPENARALLNKIFIHLKSTDE